MAKVRAIFQPFPGAVTHQKNVSDLFPKSGITEVWLSTAYINSAGVAALQAGLSSCATVTTCIVGIRNGASTAQGLAALLATGAKIYVVDTGTPYRIFHPKFYAVADKLDASVIIGSANTTYGGLYSNIEASAHIQLDRSNEADEEFLLGLINPIKHLIKTYPLNCYQINDMAQVDQLLFDGIVEDEAIPKISGPVGIASKGGKSGGIPLMALPKGPATKPKAASGPSVPTARTVSTSAAVTQPVTYGPLVWAKPSLPRSDLQFPGANGNATGVLRLTQAKFTVGGSVIDQTTYFRNQVFGKLTWSSSAGGKETSTVDLALVIAGVLVGTYNLPLSHNSAWESGQGNYTTALHWEGATPQIRHMALLGRTLSLYAPSGNSSPYVIEID